MFRQYKDFHDLKTFFNADDKIIELFHYLQAVKKYDKGDSLIITPTPEASKEVFNKMLSDFNNYIGARYVRDGKGYEFIFEGNERIIIQDITYLLNCRHHEGMRFKSINFME